MSCCEATESAGGHASETRPALGMARCGRSGARGRPPSEEPAPLEFPAHTEREI